MASGAQERARRSGLDHDRLRRAPTSPSAAYDDRAGWLLVLEQVVRRLAPMLIRESFELSPKPSRGRDWPALVAPPRRAMSARVLASFLVLALGGGIAMAAKLSLAEERAAVSTAR